MAGGIERREKKINEELRGFIFSYIPYAGSWGYPATCTHFWVFNKIPPACPLGQGGWAVWADVGAHTAGLDKNTVIITYKYIA